VLRIQREHWGDTIEVKTNIPVVLAKELRTKKPGVVGISTVTDPYQPLEQKYTLTRYCLEQLLKYDFPVHIQTKSALVTRDIDLITKLSDAQVMINIGTIKDEERKLLEPCTSSIQERLHALKKLTDAGVKTTIFFGPVYPTITREEIPHILETFKESGVPEIWIDTLNLKPGIWENIQKTLIHHPEMDKIFLKNVLQNKEYYKMIREEILKRGKEGNIKIIDAF
jgi:DNA repair photolyase